MYYFARLLWHGWFRSVCFWAIAAVSFWLFSTYISNLEVGLDWTEFKTALSSLSANGKVDLAATFGRPGFATSLAWLLAGAGFGLFFAFLIMHAALVRFSLWRARGIVEAFKERPEFAAAYEAAVYPALIAHPLIGHAWKEFDETLLRSEMGSPAVIGNTVRPQAFINYGLVKERLTGLKLLGSISGYFIGTGLLLTFVGIVLALSRAAAAVGQDGDAMQRAVAELLQIASFKFSTSIAGLGASIVFAIAAKLIVVWIEGGLTRFCEAVERQLRYTAPQSITAEMNAVGKEQRDQLKQINSDQYFTKMAEVVAPLIGAAMDRALTPVTAGIGSAIDQLKASSQSGMSDLLKEFSTSVQGSAGTELRELGETLRQMQLALTETQRGLQGTGEDFARRMSEAAENLNRLVGEAGTRLEGSADHNRDRLQEVVEALRTTFERANGKVEADLGNAAAGASSKIEEAMARVTGRLEEQMSGLMSGLQGFQASSANNLETARQQIGAAQVTAAEAVSMAANETAKALQVGLSDVLHQIGDEIDRLAQTMQSGATAYSHQAAAISEATSQTRGVADAFARTAQEVRTAAAPLVQSGEHIAKASNDISAAIVRTASGLETTNAQTSALATALTEQIDRLGAMWSGYKEQFERVDESLASAVTKLSDATGAQADRLTSFTRDMDQGLSKVLTDMRPSLDAMRENSEELSEGVANLAKVLAEATSR